MADVNLTNPPYYDDYDPNKGYTKVLAYPGRAPQSRETNVLQSMFLDFMKRLGDVLMKNGSIVSGCQLSINEAKTVATITTGQVYVNGIVYPVPESTVTITGTGEEAIGVKVSQVIITADEDPSLADPAQTYSNFGQKGADRLKEVIVVVKGDPEAFTIYKLKEGFVSTNTEPPAVDVITDVLARRTFDESENYKVRGLAVTVAPFDSETLHATVSAGKCYVLGYEINKPSPTVVKIPLSKAYRTVQDEPKLYDQNTTDYLISTAYVRSVDEVVGQAQIVQYITRGSIVGGTDELPKTPVFDIVAVNQGGDWNAGTSAFVGGKTYRKGVDYQLMDNGVDWSLAALPSDQPSLGSSYQVVWKYNRHFIQFKDFDLYLNPSNGRHYVRFLNTTESVKPIHNTTYNITYTWHLARTDLLYIDRTGNINAVQGQPNRFGLQVAPETTLYNLPLAYLALPPNSSQANITTIENTRITMKGVQDIITRVNNLEYNMAVTDLDKQAEIGETPSNLSGILTDGFLDFGRADITHPSFNTTMNLFTNEIMIPAESTLKNLALNTALSNVIQKDKFYLAPYGDTPLVSQPFASSTMNINPYAVFNTESSISLNPSVDNWIDESTIKLPITISDDEQITIPAKFVDNWWTSDVQRLLVQTQQDKKTFTGDPTKIFEQASTFMRQITVQVNGAKFSPGQDVTCKFDNKVVTLTPASGTEAGVKEGTVKVKSDGSFVGTFQIPANTTTGTKTVTLHNDSNYAERPFTSTGFTRIFVQSETTLVSTVQTFQDIYGSNNKILYDAVQEAINKANENAQAITNLDQRTQQLTARMDAVEASLRQMSGLVNELARETDGGRLIALEAQYMAQVAIGIANAADAKATEALRQAEIAVLKASAADQKAQLALAQSKAALENSQQAENSANSALALATQALNRANSVETRVNSIQTAQNTLFARTQALETEYAALQSGLSSERAQRIATAQALQGDINSLKSQMQTLSTEVSGDQRIIDQIAAQLGFTVNQVSNTINRIDPLAQSFAFETNTQISSIDVFFYSKGTLPINLQVREMSEGGLPTTRVVGEKTFYAQDVLLSNNASVATKVIFDTPVFCEANKDYCFVLITEDTDYNVFIGKLGERDVQSNAVIGRQPYTIGVLFSSSNNISWNVHNDADLKFNINVVSVSGDAVLVFEDIPVTSVSEIVLAVEQLVPEQTRIEWEYQINGNGFWHPLTAFEKTATDAVASNIRLKSTIQAKLGSHVSPTILRGTSFVYAMSRQSNASYITKNVDLASPYSGVKQVIDMNLPTGTSYELQFSPDNGVTWITVPQTSVQPVDQRYSRFFHEAELVVQRPALTNPKLTPAATGGTLPNATYYYVVTAINSEGETTGVQVNTTITGGSNSGKVTIDLTGLIPAGATGIKIYRGTSSGSAALKYVFNTIPSDLLIVDTGADTDASTATPPTTNTATTTSTKFRGRIVLSTSNILNTPRAKRFINIMRV
jgi:hypothetical protein